MVDRFDIREGMEVVGSDGAPVGVVRDVETGRILLRDAADGSGDADIAIRHVDRVEDGRVHLNDSARVALGGFGARVAEAVGDPAPAQPHEPVPPTLNRAVPGARPRGNFYLPWILGAVGLLALFFLYRGCVAEQEEDLLVAPPRIERGVVSPVGAAGALPAELRTYLTGTEPAGRTFRFDRLNFDTNSAAIRPADQADLNAVAEVLQAHPSARVRIVGYADARGTAPANAELGRERAEAVVAALTGRGVARARMEAVSGGEADPAATNATAPGQAENRRTELVVTAR